MGLNNVEALLLLCLRRVCRHGVTVSVSPRHRLRGSGRARGYVSDKMGPRGAGVVRLVRYFPHRGERGVLFCL